VDQASPAEVEALAAEISALTAAPQVRSAYRVADVLDGAGSSRGPGWLAGRRVMLVAGLARPQSFRRTLAAAGAQVVAEALFADHHWFTAAELCAAARRARESGAQALALTEKDAVRLPQGSWGAPLAVVQIELEVQVGSEAIDRALEAIWAR
jgi:tetraacyldisaccharide 4'-kinase